MVVSTFAVVYFALPLMLPVVYHAFMSAVIANAYRKAFREYPEHRCWPEWYTGSVFSLMRHFVAGIVRPWETLPCIGKVVNSELITFNFTYVMPKIKIKKVDD